MGDTKSFAERVTELERKYGLTLIGTLRRTYGAAFAPNCADNMTLRHALQRLDGASISKLVADEEAGSLEQYCRE